MYKKAYNQTLKSIRQQYEKNAHLGQTMNAEIGLLYSNVLLLLLDWYYC